jgi:hypothetical protein
MKSVNNFIYKYFCQDSGKMILITSILGMGLSCIAQSAAILNNKEYSFSQKLFMVPQEIVEFFVSAFSIMAVTTPLKKFASKLTKTGKVLTKDLKKYAEDNNLMGKVGDKDFNFAEEVNNIMQKIELSDKFIKSGMAEKESMLKPHKENLKKHEVFSDSASAIAATTGGVISVSILSPMLRNAVASKFHKVGMDKINSLPDYDIDYVWDYKKELNSAMLNKPNFTSNNYSKHTLFNI